MSTRSRQMTVNHIKSLVKKHHQWRSSCINLIASENITSLAVREILASDLAHRYAEGEPYRRMYEGTRYFDEIEDFTIQMAKKLFGAEHANLKPISGCQSNLAVFYALANVGDTIMALNLPEGGHISYMEFGGAGVRGLKVSSFPFDPKEMNVDLEATVKKARSIRPTVYQLGGSIILFPYPVKEIKQLSEELGGCVAYDASHVLGLIAGKQFQDPLREGVDVVASSTHKTFPGPQGGMILCRRELAEKIDRAVFPGLTSNHHLHRVAALAVALIEMEKFGEIYERQVVRNAKALAEALHNSGFNVLCAHKGFTQSHQVLVDVRDRGGGKLVADRLEEANIICNKNIFPGDNINNPDNPSGIRLGTSEVTRLGMRGSEMQQVAEYIGKAVDEKNNPRKIACEVKNFMEKFKVVEYSFNKGEEAYKYIDFY